MNKTKKHRCLVCNVRTNKAPLIYRNTNACCGDHYDKLRTNDDSD